MKYGFARAALISPQTIPGAIDNNKAELLKAIFSATEKSSEIILSGRLSLSGNSCGSMFFHQSFLQGCVDALASIMNETKNLSNLIVIGMPMKLANKIYDCSVIISKGKVLAFVPHLSDNSAFSDYPDGEITYIKMDGAEVPFGKDIVFYNTALDYSMKFSDASDSLPHAEIVLRPLAAQRTMGSRANELSFCKNMSLNDSCAVLSVSAAQTGCAEQRIYDDFKFLCELGNQIDTKDKKDSTLQIYEIDISGVSHATSIANNSSYPEYSFVTIDFAISNNDSTLLRTFSKRPLAPASEDDCNEVIDILISGIRTKLTECKHEKIMFGLSGGLDSAHILMLCHHLFVKYKMPTSNIIAVTMPSAHSSKRTAKNAARLIELLGVSTLNIPITAAVKKHLKDIGHEEHDVVYENAQARERTQILLDLANKHNALLLGTSDLSELCIGFGTYGGDLTAHYNPNGGLTKTAIRYIVKYFAEALTEKAVGKVLNDILKTPVSPELLENQQTEALLGSYELHDFFIHCLILKGYDINKTVYLAERAFSDKQRKDLIAVLRIFVERFLKYRFKQNFSCDSPVVINNALSELLSNSRSGFSPQIWLNELKNVKSAE